ncbi:MAG: hypothetical protein GTO53_10710 [Planctomycetales bacterium]|nr:hypothetical protein [Planctomycetales bacterium]NIM09591.1 hypothetical protein [Planctomycetales bacterium]NIN09080.1 hypothetical protein [Planctomycetales bacterium]NIN78190.1 hypothetical protein [Planctomycetales bacterium]NIO35376.1 hypothetical protein [Planctomycetales bacterium]
MPKVSVHVAHDKQPDDALAIVQPALEKTVRDFQGRDLEVDWQDTRGTFSFKSMAFTIKGHVAIQDEAVVVDIDLPFAAMMFKEKAEKALKKNISRAFEQA